MSFLKVLGVAVRKGRVTVRYPFEPPLVTPFFRGKISVDPSKCLGCGACARICPPKALELVREGDSFVLRYFIGRCIFCAMCFDTCPAKAIEVGHDFELATTKIEDLYEELVHEPARCSICGEPFLPKKLVDQVFENLNGLVPRDRVEECPRCRRMGVLQILASSRNRFGSDLMKVEGG